MDAHTPDTSRGPVVHMTEADLRDLRRLAIEGAVIAVAAWIVAAAAYVLTRGG